MMKMEDSVENECCVISRMQGFFKPRLLVHGARGMGQGYIGAAVLHHFEGFHVQTVNLPILMGDPSRVSFF